jgi:hypothetical protein
LKAVKMILAARKVDVADGSAEQAAINKEIAGMGAEKLTASHACGIFASMREETFFAAQTSPPQVCTSQALYAFVGAE